MFSSMTDLVNDAIISLSFLRDYLSEKNESDIQNELHSAASTYSELLRTIDSDDKDSMELFEKHEKILGRYFENGIDYMIENSTSIKEEIYQIIRELQELVEHRVA